MSITRPSGTSARSTLARHPPAVGQSNRARQALLDCPNLSSRHQHPRPVDVPDGNVQRQVWRGGPREGSDRDASVLLMLQRDCMVSMPAIRASQPSPTRALVHSQQVALTRAAAPPQRSWRLLKTRLDGILPCSEAGDAGEEAEVDDSIIDRGAQHATGAPGSAASAASGLVLAASRYTWVAPESGPWAKPV